MRLFKDFLSAITTHRFLLGQFSIRDFTARYKGTYFGLLWSVLLPVIMVATYTFVFGFVFKSRWAGSSSEEGRLFFATTLFAGLIPFNFFADVLISSASIIQANTNLVKKVVFPLEILPLSRVISAMSHSILSLVILLVLLAYQNIFYATLLYAPLVLIPFILFCLGLSFFISALAVFVRDVMHVLGTVVSLCMFLSPIFYSVESIPASIRPIAFLNPIAIVAESMRKVAIFGTPPLAEELLILWGVGLCTLVLGVIWFTKLKTSFADVM